MPYFKNTPYDKHYPITKPGGGWKAHLKRLDVGVDRPIPCKTKIYSIFNKARIKYKYVFVPPWSRHKPAGIRRVVRMLEMEGKNYTGRIFEVWHVSTFLVKHGTVVKGRVKVAKTGKSGAYSCHVHEVAHRRGDGRAFDHQKHFNNAYRREGKPIN